MTPRYMLSSLILMLSTASSYAQPTSGILYAQDSVSFTAYRCDPPLTSGDIDCRFNQTLISLKPPKPPVTPAMLDEYRAEIAKQSPEERRTGCRELDLANIEEVPMPEEIRDHARRHLAEFRKLLCTDEQVDEEALLGAANKVAGNVCTVGSNHYQMRFRRSSEDSPVWLADSPPSAGDPCGLVNLTRLEPDPDIPGLWRMVSRRAVQNPSAKTALGQSCSDWEQPETLHGTSGRKSLTDFCYSFEFQPFGL